MSVPYCFVWKHHTFLIASSLRSDLHMLFEMIDTDQSGTIEASEFIGPLSRWAHDSKTAPRFIKYNMLQSMQLQEDLYDMCADCFKHLALQIDKVACDVEGLSKEMGKTKIEKSITPTETQSNTTQESYVSPVPSRASVDEGKGAFETTNPAAKDFEEPENLLEAEHVEDHEINEMEHVMAVKPSRETEMLNSRDNNNQWKHLDHLDVLIESMVMKLDVSVKKMEKFARAADIMVRKWNEAPEHHHRRRIPGHSVSTPSRKSDVFWAMYMDREHARDRKAKRRHTHSSGSARQNWRQDTMNVDEKPDFSMIGVSEGNSMPQRAATHAFK